MKIVLKGEKPMSWNELYSGAHWSVRRAEAEAVHMVVANIVKTYKPFDAPVHITITAYFKGRAFDADNICTKLYIDGLKGYVIHDDSPKYVVGVTAQSRTDRKNTRVEIDVLTCEL